MKAVVIHGRHHWGFSVRVPYTSASSESYPVPPPTTIVGALSKPYCLEVGYAVRNGESCTREFVEKEVKNDLVWVTYALVEGGAVQYADIVRQQRLTYRQSKYRKSEFSPSESFGIATFGKMYTGVSQFKVILVLSNNADSNKWVRWGWQLTNLGTKESLVTVTNVTANDLVNPPDELEVRAYFPRDCLTSDVSVIGGVSDVVDLPLSNQYELVGSAVNAQSPVTMSFIVPRLSVIYGGSVRVRRQDVRDDCSVYAVKDCGDCGHIIIPSQDFLRRSLGVDNLADAMLTRRSIPILRSERRRGRKRGEGS